MQVEIIHDAQATLGEGPAWDAKTDTLYWVDILDKRVHYHREDENGFIQLDITLLLKVNDPGWTRTIVVWV